MRLPAPVACAYADQKDNRRLHQQTVPSVRPSRYAWFSVSPGVLRPNGVGDSPGAPLPHPAPPSNSDRAVVQQIAVIRGLPAPYSLANAVELLRGSVLIVDTFDNQVTRPAVGGPALPRTVQIGYWVR